MMQMPTDVVMRRTTELVPYANNARTHTAEQVQEIAASASTRYRASSEEGFDLSLMGLG
jgi:hypothetical protein